MERTKQFVLSALKPIFDRKSARHSQSHEEAPIVYIAPPPYSELPPRISDTFNGSRTPPTNQARTNQRPPSGLPSRQRKEPTVLFHKRQTNHVSSDNFSQAPLCSESPPASPVADCPPIMCVPSAGGGHCNLAPNHHMGYHTPLISPKPSIYAPSMYSADILMQDAPPTAPESHIKVSQPRSIFRDQQRLPPMQPALSAAQNTSASCFESNLSEGDRLSHRFAKLRIGTGAPKHLEQLEHPAAAPPLATFLPRITSTEAAPKRTNSLMFTPSPIRRRPAPDALGPAAGQLSVAATKQTEVFGQENEDRNLRPYLSETNPFSKTSHTTRRLPTSFPTGTSTSLTGNEHPLYPDLSAALVQSVANVSLLQESNATSLELPDTDDNAVAMQKWVDRNLAEALQQIEDDEHEEFLAWTSFQNGEYSNVLRTEKTNRSTASALNNGVTAKEMRDDQMNLDKSSELGRSTGEVSRDLLLSATIEPKAEKGEKESGRSKKKKRKTVAGATERSGARASSQHRSTKQWLDCAVCGDKVRAAGTPHLKSCKHVPQICRDCFAAWIKSELDSKGWRSIKCPGSDCRVTLTYEEVQKYATKEVFNQYDNLAMRAVLSNDPDFRWCRAAGCTSGQIHLSGEDGNIFRCNACGHRVCVVHDATFHEGETCQEYDYRISGKKEEDQRKQEEASERAVKKLSKKCPGKGCSYSIQKNAGCDHMTCTQCRYEFCFECLADYNKIRKKGNGAHKKSCKYHSSRIEAYDSE